jgi:C-terminal processing protease CtpA/Prc
VVVLCNRRSYSATNSFVSLMRYADDATIVGGVSGGGGGMPLSYEMPCGWTVRFSSVRMYDREKKDIEQGITPDVTVTMTSTDKDDIIEKAIDLILNR